jgi:acetyl-CoA synthetase
MMPDHVRPFIAARDLLLRLATDYDAAVREFSWPVMDRFNWALDYFDHLPADDLALWCVGGATEEKLTFGQLRVRSNQVANHLRELGVRRGDRVMLLMPNIRQFYESLLALIKLGAVINPNTVLLTAAEVTERFERGRMRHAIVDASLTGCFAGLPGKYTRIAVGGTPGWRRFEDAYGAPEDFVADGETSASDLLVMYFTSGTTSKPKMVLHSQGYPVGLLTAMYCIGSQPGDLQMGIAPPGWAGHTYGLFGGWNAGTAILALALPRFDAKRVLDVIARCGASVFWGPPTVWRLLIQEDMAARPVRLRAVGSGGEPLNPEVLNHVRRVWGLDVRDAYGQTETALLAGNPIGQKIVPGSMGRPMPGFVVKILDENGAETDEGEIAVGLDPPPLGLLQGYQQEDGSVSTIEGEFYRTGDLAVRGPDGYLTFVGRADDVFKSSDYRLSPFEIESALIEHPAVAEAAVVPSPDPQRLVVPKAFVTLAAGYPPKAAAALDIFSGLRGRLAPYKRVRRIEFGELPKTISGKIRRAELRRQEAARRKQGLRAEAEFWEEDFPELRRPERSENR